jgi:GNAT superfamily N-acetyltransferase
MLAALSTTAMTHQFVISTEKSKLDIDIIHAFLSTSYWAKDIPRSIVEKSIENSLCFGAYNGNAQIGFARVISDFATFAYLGDVFVLEDYRGKGISKMLMKEIIQHPRLQGLRRFMLATRDAHGLYKQFGFVPTASPERMMEIVDSEIYQRTSTQQ